MPVQPAPAPASITVGQLWLRKTSSSFDVFEVVAVETPVVVVKQFGRRQELAESIHIEEFRQQFEFHSTPVGFPFIPTPNQVWRDTSSYAHDLSLSLHVLREVSNTRVRFSPLVARTGAPHWRSIGRSLFDQTFEYAYDSPTTAYTSEIARLVSRTRTLLAARANANQSERLEPEPVGKESNPTRGASNPTRNESRMSDHDASNQTRNESRMSLPVDGARSAPFEPLPEAELNALAAAYASSVADRLGKDPRANAEEPPFTDTPADEWSAFWALMERVLEQPLGTQRRAVMELLANAKHPPHGYSVNHPSRKCEPAAEAPPKRDPSIVLFEALGEIVRSVQLATVSARDLVRQLHSGKRDERR